VSGISRIPAGLLGFLGIKNGGQYPQRLATELLPTWDLSDQYSEYGAQLQGLNLQVTATGYIAYFTPPVGEVWRIHDIGLTVQCAVAELFLGSVARSQTAGGTVVPITDHLSVAASSSGVVVVPRVPMFLNPGDNLGVITYAFAGSSDGYLQIRYTVMTM